MILAEFRVWWQYYYVAHSDRFRISAFQASNVTENIISFPCNSTDQRHTEYHWHTSALFAHSNRYQTMQLINLKVQSLPTTQDKLTKLLAKKIPCLHETHKFRHIIHKKQTAAFGLHPSRIHPI